MTTTMQLRGAFAYIRGVDVFHYLEADPVGPLSTKPLCDKIKVGDPGYDVAWIEEKIDRLVCSECLRLWDEVTGSNRQLTLGA